MQFSLFIEHFVGGLGNTRGAKEIEKQQLINNLTNVFKYDRYIKRI